MLRYQKLLEVAIGLMPGCFGMFAHDAGLAEFNDKGPEVGPVIFMSNQIESFALTKVAREDMIMFLLQNSEPKVISIGNIYVIVMPE